jgi:hypothetical protein
MNRRTMASVAGAAALVLAAASWAPALATEPPAPGGVSAGGPAVVVGSMKPIVAPTPTPIPTVTPAATPTPTPVPTASPAMTVPAASATPTGPATQSPQSSSQGGTSTGLAIPMVFGGILVLGLLAGILTFVLLGRRSARG